MTELLVPPKTDMQIKLSDALKKAGYVAPKTEILQEMQEQIEEHFGPDIFSSSELSKAFSRRYVRNLITKERVTTIHNFMMYVHDHYQDFKTGLAGGMTKFMEKHSIDGAYRVALLSMKMLNSEGTKREMKYKWAKGKPTKDDAMEVIMHVNADKRERAKKQKASSLNAIQKKKIEEEVRKGKEARDIVNFNHPELEGLDRQYLYRKIHEAIEEYRNPKIGTKNMKIIAEGKLPNENAVLDRTKLPITPPRFWDDYELCVLYFYTYHGKSNTEISEAIGRNQSSIALKKNKLKKEGYLSPTEVKKFLARHIDKLQELFSVKVVEKNEPIETNKKETVIMTDKKEIMSEENETQNPTLFTQTGTSITAKTVYHGQQIPEGVVKALVDQIASNEREMRKNRKTMEHMDKKLNEMQGYILKLMSNAL